MNRKQILLIIGIVFIAFNLRAPLTSIGSLVSLIKADTNLSNSAAGFITTLPLLTFAVFSPFVTKIGEKVGNGLTMLLGMVLIILGELIRSYTSVPGIFIGTTIIGIGIAIGNVLIPSIIKLKFPDRIGFVTSLYSPCMSIFGGLASGFSIPLATGLNIGWKNALATWSILGLITIIVWLPQLRRKSAPISDSKVESTTEAPTIKPTNNKIWKSPLAWQVTMFMGLQSILFYSIMAWLPSIMQTHNIDLKTAGFMTLFIQIIAVPSGFIASQIAGKYKDQRAVTTTISVIYFLGTIGLLVGGSTTMLYIYLICIGIGIGASISLALTFMGLRTSNAKEASKLSGMAQSIGYLFAAIGPFVIGAIYDHTGSFTIPVVLFIAFTVLLIITGYLAGRNKYIFE